MLANHPGPNFDEIVASRRGYGAPGDAMLTLNKDFPTFFINPFRPPGTGRLVPLAGDPSDATPGMEAEGADVTMMRRAGTLTSPGTQPLFANTEPQIFPDANPPRIVNDPNRNSFTRYQPLQRLGNLVTTRSNVFAIWITVGYFEVVPHPTTGDPSLGAELGSETGDIRRHRGFYVVDRSIPIAFQPGHNHNMERAVLLRRFIE